MSVDVWEGMKNGSGARLNCTKPIDGIPTLKRFACLYVVMSFFQGVESLCTFRIGSLVRSTENER